MALPTGRITLGNLKAHFGDTDPIRLGDYYANSSSSFANGLNVPASGNRILLGGFRGKQKHTTGTLLRRYFTLNSGTASLNAAEMNAAFRNTNAISLTQVTSLAPFGGDLIGLEFTGWFVPTTSGNHTFGLTSDDGSDMALYIGGTWDIVTNAYGYKAPEASPPVNGTRNLTAHFPYPIRIRFHEQGGGEALNLFWIPPGAGGYSAIPMSVFRSATTVLAEGFPNPVVTYGFILNGLILHLDPGISTSYSGTGASISNLTLPNITCTLFGTYSYSAATAGGSIRLSNTSGNRLANVSYLQFPTITKVRTVSIWYYIHSVSDTRYIIDAREGASAGYITDGGFGTVWTQFYVNGGTVQGTTTDMLNILVNQTGVWKHVTLIANVDVSDDITVFARFSGNEGLDVTFGAIFVYDRVITEAENTFNYNALRSRYGL
jgi:hypothetical protein